MNGKALYEKYREVSSLNDVEVEETWEMLADKEREIWGDLALCVEDGELKE